MWREMKKLWIAMFLMIAIVVAGCGPAENDGNRDDNGIELQREGAREFNIEAGAHGYFALSYIEHMQDALPNRLPFTDRELETAEWIVATLIEMGFSEDQVEVQTFRYDTPTSTWWGGPERHMERYKETGHYAGRERIDYSQNIILTLPGQSAETIVIGAHYDGVGNPGISDNAAGVALLLESAYRMQDLDHYYTLQYVFFGAEEVGLIGVFYFADQLTEVEIDHLILMINADVILDGPNLVYAVGYIEELPEWPMELVFGGAEAEVLQNAITMQIDDLAAEDTQLIAKPHAIFSPSDHLAFLQFGIPIVYFYGTHPVQYPDRFHGDVVHSPDDDLDFIMENFPGRIENALDSFGRFLERILMFEF